MKNSLLAATFELLLPEPATSYPTGTPDVLEEIQTGTLAELISEPLSADQDAIHEIAKNHLKDGVPTITRANTVTSPKPRAQVRTRMEGVVQRADGESFWAILRDLDDPNRPEELAEFDRQSLMQSDEKLVAEGAVFYFSVGYRTNEKGTRSAFSEVRFRRLPEWTQRDLDSLEKISDDVEDLFS